MNEGRWIKVPDRKHLWINFPHVWKMGLYENKSPEFGGNYFIEIEVPDSIGGLTFYFDTEQEALNWIAENFGIETK